MTETYDSINRLSEEADNAGIEDITEKISLEGEKIRRYENDLELGIPMDLNEFELDAESPFTISLSPTKLKKPS